jgi:Ca-activated chloride channel family protein
MNGLRLHDPLWLLLLIPLLALGFMGIRRSRRAAILFSSTAMLRQLPKTIRQRIRWLMPWLRIAGLALVVAALARPQYGREEFRIRADGIAIEMCLDRSGSMQAMDFELDGERVSRLEVVKDVFKKFITGEGGLSGRPDDQIGLISFGGFADAVCPQTLDHGTLLQLLTSVRIAEPIYDANGNIVNRELMAEEQATAIGDAVTLAVDRLKDSTAKSKIIILLSDGENTAGVIQPEEAAAAAKQFGVKVYSIGVGTTGVAPFPGTDFFGRPVLDRRPVRLDEATLKLLAETTGGRYFNAKDTQTLENVYEEIDALEKTETDGQLYTDYRELYQWLVIPGICLVVLEVVLSSTWLRSLP